MSGSSKRHGLGCIGTLSVGAFHLCARGVLLACFGKVTWYTNDLNVSIGVVKTLTPRCYVIGVEGFV